MYVNSIWITDIFFFFFFFGGGGCACHLSLSTRLYYMRLGWKLHRLAKELCHSNETWRALNSTFPDTNCIVSFQINPHWISNSGLWKEVVETFQNGLENLQRESCFTRTMLLHTSLWLQWMMCVTVAFELVDHPPYSPDLAPSDYSLFPTMKKRLAGKQYRTTMWSYLQLRTFSRIRMRASIPQESKHCNTDGRSV